VTFCDRGVCALAHEGGRDRLCSRHGFIHAHGGT
jgi:hypothetical protein